MLLSFDSRQRKDTPVSFAVRASMSIPIFFTPERSEGLNLFDGGMRHNYPVRRLLSSDPSKEFIGLYLGDEVYVAHRPSVLGDLINIAFEGSDVEALMEFKESTVVIDPTPVSTLDFRLSHEDKEFLFQQGRLSALKFLSRRSQVDAREIDGAIQEAGYARKRAVERRQRRKQINRRYFVGGTALSAIAIGATRYFRVWPFSETDPTTWGAVLGSGDGFQNAVELFTKPLLTWDPAGGKIGKVHARNGIGFWGNVFTNSAGAIDPRRSRIHIEIHDYQEESQQTMRIVFPIGFDHADFVDARLVNGDIIFESTHGSVRLVGDVSYGLFLGTMYFSNTYTNNKWVPLGTFVVHAKGFLNYLN